MKGQLTCALMLATVMIGAAIATPDRLAAQDNGLKITISRPGEGEILYSGPNAPLTTAPITGSVSADDFDVGQLQVRLEVLQGTQSHGSLTTTPQPNGAYSFNVAINSRPPFDEGCVETSCIANCHSATPLRPPEGAVLLHLIVSDPLGHKATAQRKVIVEESRDKTVPVRVMLSDEPGRGIEGLRVVATTRLYEWRAREFSANTDAEGKALLPVEVLSQGTTLYSLRIEPSIRDGVLYQGREPVQVTLAPGAATAEPVMLIAESRRGRLGVTLNSKIPDFRDSSGLVVRAVDQWRGAVFSTEVNQGQATFTDLPLSQYLLTVDDEEIASRGMQGMSQAVDLRTTPVASATLTLVAASGRTIQGTVHDGRGTPLPFVWVTTNAKGQASRVAPASGEFFLHGLGPEARSVWVTAPGYWSRPVANRGDRLDIVLTPRPDTRSIPWGTGMITWPGQTNASVSGDRISLRRGWIWGQGTGALEIDLPELQITLQSGSFAIEDLPEGISWLYTLNAKTQAAVRIEDGTLVMTGNQMLAFGKGIPHPSPVTLDAAAVRLLHAGEISPVAVETDSDIPARVRDEVERLGIPFSWAVILTPIAAATTALVGIWALRYRRRRARRLAG